MFVFVTGVGIPPPVEFGVRICSDMHFWGSCGVLKVAMAQLEMPAGYSDICFWYVRLGTCLPLLLATSLMRFSEPQRMCEQLLLFGVFLVFFWCFDFAFFSCFFPVVFCCRVFFGILLLLVVAFCFIAPSSFLFFSPFAISACLRACRWPLFFPFCWSCPRFLVIAALCLWFPSLWHFACAEFRNKRPARQSKLKICMSLCSAATS